jgi:hypothetical protein
MKGIANLRDGIFCYIEELDMVEEYFVSAIGGLMSIGA